MNLYLFPAPANTDGGYNIAVLAAIKSGHVTITARDDVLWLGDQSSNDFFRPHHRKRMPRRLWSASSVSNIMRGRFSQELGPRELACFRGNDYTGIHCDDVIFYRAARELFPEAKLVVRFHNVFSRIRERAAILGVKPDWRFRGKIEILAGLERAVMRDNNVRKVFLTNEDASFYSAMTGRTDYELWPLLPDRQKMVASRCRPLTVKHLVWVGGVEGHKLQSICWFIDEVFPAVRKRHPEIEAHFYGARTERLNSRAAGVHGHGYYYGGGLPFRESALYLNPDILGGGVKVKLMSYMESGAPFITTPFGYEGYDRGLIDDDFCIVAPADRWGERIDAYVRTAHAGA
jgi:hypothetical protein